MTLRVLTGSRWPEFVRLGLDGTPLQRWRCRQGQWESRRAVGEPWSKVRWTQVPPDVRQRQAQGTKVD